MNENFNLFKTAKGLCYINLCLLLVSSILVLLNVIFAKEIIEIINCIIILIYYGLSIVINRLLYKGEKYRRNDLIDNSYNSNIILNHTAGYYASNNRPLGIVKMALHVFESCFYTCNQLKIQLRRDTIISVIFIIIYSFLAFKGYNNLLLLLFQLLLPINIIKHCIIDFQAYSDLKLVLESFNIIARNSFFTEDKEVELIKNIEDYNTILSNFHILLSEKIYNKNKDKLAQGWNDIQKRYNLE